MMMIFTPERHLPTSVSRASPQRHTAAGIAAPTPTTADTGNRRP